MAVFAESSLAHHGLPMENNGGEDRMRRNWWGKGARAVARTCILVVAPVLWIGGCALQEALVPRELLRNGSFSEGGVNWGIVGDFWVGANPAAFPDYRTPPEYAAGGVDLAGRPKNKAEGMLYQTVRIPSGATGLTVSFWYNVTSEEPRGAMPADRMLVVFLDAAGEQIIGLVRELSNTEQAFLGDYRPVTQTVPVDSALRGQTVRFAFVAWTDEDRPTVFRIDDVSVKWE